MQRANMATLEKLVRTVEALKLHQTPSVTVDETMGKKEKTAHCVSVTDVLCTQVRWVAVRTVLTATQGLKNSPESAKYLAMAMEMYFTLLDDSDADVRMVADENLNRVTRSLGDSSVGRLQVSTILASLGIIDHVLGIIVPVWDNLTDRCNNIPFIFFEKTQAYYYGAMKTL